jgi:Transposase IS116/IS110/IS902 family
VNCDCWSIIVKTWSASVPASSPGCAGICTSSTPGWTPPTKLQRDSAFDKVQAHLSRRDDGAIVRRLALRLVEHLRLLTEEIDELTAEITVRVTRIAPSLLAIVGCGALSAAKIIGETAHAGRFRSKDAFARHNGTAPLPVWSSNKQRHRLSRTGNRQLNAALHRIALTQARCYPPARALLERRTNSGDGGMSSPATGAPSGIASPGKRRAARTEPTAPREVRSSAVRAYPPPALALPKHHCAGVDQVVTDRRWRRKR